MDSINLPSEAFRRRGDISNIACLIYWIMSTCHNGGINTQFKMKVLPAVRRVQELLYHPVGTKQIFTYI